MGKGIALQFRQKFSEDYFKDYKRASQSGQLAIGKVHVFEIENNTDPHYIINFPTKRHWRGKSLSEDIESGLNSLAETIEKPAIKSIAMPALGCGLGNLNWGQVKILIENTFSKILNIDVLLFFPNRE